MARGFLKCCLFKNKKNFHGLLFTAFALFGLVTLVYVVQKPQDIREMAAGSSSEAIHKCLDSDGGGEDQIYDYGCAGLDEETGGCDSCSTKHPGHITEYYCGDEANRETVVLSGLRVCPGLSCTGGQCATPTPVNIN